MNINLQFNLFTDTAVIAVFDSARLGNRVDGESDWWCSDLSQIAEVRTGSIALVSLGGDGVYRVRVTDGDMTVDERDYAASAVCGLGVEVISGKLYAGPAECMPGGGIGFTPASEERGLVLECDDGAYDVELFAIHWRDSPRWWKDDHSVPDDAPVDIVATLRPRQRPFSAGSGECRLDFYGNNYLYESATRRVGPEPGMILTTKVRRGPSSELCLKGCGPLGYRASLIEYSGVAWKDTIRIRVVAVDHDAKQLTAEFVSKAEIS